MNTTFQQQLDYELLHSERKRTIILISIFLFAAGYRAMDVFFFKAYEDGQPFPSLPTIWLFPLVVALFEIFSLFYINKRIKTNGKKIPIALQYLNTGVEICLPSLIMLVVAKHYPSYDVFQMPVLYIYFLFIILSTLRLNFWLSFLCGLIASASFALLSSFVYHHFDANDAARAAIILISGIAAGLVAKQIREGINKSLNEAERRHRVENIFGQQMSEEVALKMLENDGKIESKRMTAAVMFIDIRNFTKFAVKRNPEEIVQYQNAFFKIVIDTISKFNGIVHQFLGDGCMVTFGAPLDLENPSQNAVDAANMLISEINTSIRNGGLAETEIGMGIHTGEVITGNIGTEQRQQYSITGNVVILASRIEQLNKRFGSQILVSEEVVRSINSEAARPVYLDAVELKGWH